jgi:hypothetical protein
MRFALRALAATLVVAAVAPGGSSASTSGTHDHTGEGGDPAAVAAAVRAVDAPVRTRLVARRAADRDCVTSVREDASVAAHRWIAPADGTWRVRLAGARGVGDWDLAVFEATSLRRVASSAGFGAREFAEVTVRRGASLLVQACRRSGRASTATLTTQLTRLDLPGLVAAAGAKAAATTALVEVTLGDRGDLTRLEATGVDVTHDVDARSARVLAHGAADLARLHEAGFTTRTVVADLAAADRASRAADRRALRQSGGSGLPTGRTTYRTYEDYQRELKEIAERFPRIVRGRTLRNRTFQGRDLQYLEISRDVAGPDDGRPTFILNALHHAREWPSAESAMEFAWDLVQGDGRDPRITKLLDTVRVVVMPITNADGFVLSRTAPDVDPDQETDVGFLYELATGVVVQGGTLSYKRKNCNPVLVPIPEIPCAFAIGVDPNRNYAESWGGPGASSNPNDQSFRGPGPFSEPEVLAVRELVSGTNPTSLLTIHNVAALILRPPGLSADGLAPDEPQLKALGDAMAAATGYTSQYGWQLYDTTGTTDDWSYSATGGFGYTVEIGPENGSFHGNYAEHVVDQYTGTGPTAGRGLREAYLLAAEAARNPAYTSRIAGRAPAGRTLQITKTFETETSPVCQIAEVLPLRPTDPGEASPTSCIGRGPVQKVPEKLEFSTRVPASGRFEWWVNPSTRPFVARAGIQERYTLRCLDGDTVRQTEEVFVARGESAKLELPCGGVLPPAEATNGGGVNVTLGRVLTPLAAVNRRRRGIITVRARGGSLRDVRVRLFTRTGKAILGEARATRLSGTRRLGVRLRRGVRLKPGTYRLRLTAKQSKGSPVTLTRAVPLRAAKRRR